MALTEAQIRRLAPEVRLHPRERYFPTNPIAFVRASRFRHHRDPWEEKGEHDGHDDDETERPWDWAIVP